MASIILDHTAASRSQCRGGLVSTQPGIAPGARWIKPFLLAFALICVACLTQAQVNVLTANYDNQRTNANVQENVLTPRNVNPTSFGKIGTFPVDGIIYAQILYVCNVQISGKGMHNVVYLATMHNSVYAIDADAPQSTSPLWKVNLGPSISSAVFNFSDILPEVGILSTPVIDLSRGVIYVMADTVESGSPVFSLHALSLSDGSEQMNGPVQIAASVPGIGHGRDKSGMVRFDASLHLQRPGLTLVNDAIYAAFGSHADFGGWHGWLMSYDASNLQHQLGVVNTSTNGLGASIWQAGRGLIVDEYGELYAVTGNGDYDGQSAFGESLLHFSAPSLHREGRASAGLRIVDWFTPQDWSQLNDDDDDFGSSGAILIPNTNLIMAGSKAGYLYLVPRDSMGHVQNPVGSTIQTVKVNAWGLFDLALWPRQSSATAYVAEPFGSVKAVEIVNGQISSTVDSQFPIPSSLFVGLAVSANGDSDGIVWLTTSDFSASGVPGTLHALDATDLSIELWSSDSQAARDGLGRFAKFVAPTVANGKVFVPTFSNAMVIYGPLSASPQSANPPHVTALVNSASLLGQAVAPGELVTIFGANLGTSAPARLQVSETGQVATSLADTEVQFDGVPAPLVYVSSVQVSAMAPSWFSAPTTEVQVTYRGQVSNTLTVPVVPAAPGVFSFDGTGGGLGIINENGQQNNAGATAAPGSTVTFYATGSGQTVPISPDGLVSFRAMSALPLLPLRVLINGQPADLRYAGPAPGMVPGILQVNVRVPDSVTGYDLPVQLQVGEFPSANILNINVQ